MFCSSYFKVVSIGGIETCDVICCYNRTLLFSYIRRRRGTALTLPLRTDEPDEVIVVKKALTEHLDMDPRITLGVLCDQIVPPNDPMDEEEQFTRDRLRSLVLSFLTGEAKRAIVERHASPGSDAEDVLVNGILTVSSPFSTL